MTETKLPITGTFVGVTILIVITRTRVVTPTKKIVVLSNKVVVAYFSSFNEFSKLNTFFSWNVEYLE